MNKREKKQTGTERKGLIGLALTSIVALVLILGLSYAWFFRQGNIATLMQVSPPAEISINGPNGNRLELDLSYTENDVKDGKVTIRRVISVKNTGEDHLLEIAHTTNMKGLTFKLYRAAEADGGNITDGGYTYSYNSTAPIEGNYLNAQSSGTGDYKYATDTQHSRNYGEYKKVQTHAEPLYWLVSNKQGAAKPENWTDGTECLTYYVLEISWTETDKETDMFYLLAKNA